MPVKLDQTYEAIRLQLVNGELKIGERVSEQGLAEKLGVSRSPVREAIKRLQRDGYFEQVHRYGTIVREPTIEEVGEAYDLRAALEPYAIRNARHRDFAPHLLELRELCNRMKRVAEDSLEEMSAPDREKLLTGFFEADEEFHSLLLRCSGNNRFQNLVNDARLFAQIHGVRRHSVITFDTIMGVYRDHLRILKQFDAENLAQAAEEMARHIFESKDGAMDWLRYQQRLREANRSEH
ncbi:MAG: GntR family transcriptional regulator [Planctomycetota bacterium]